MSDKSPVSASFYEQRANTRKARLAVLEQRSRLFSNLRGLTFAIFVIAALLALFGPLGRLGGFVSALGLLTFVVLVVGHAKIIDALELEQRWVETNEDAAARVTPKRWHELPQQGQHLKPNGHPYADDLDLFGKGSLFQRLCVAHTEPGQMQLAAFLLAPADLATAELRQQHIAALAPELELRQLLEVHARATLPRTRKGEKPSEPTRLEPLLDWAEGSPSLLDRPALLWAARLLPLLTASTAALASLGLVHAWILLALFVGHIFVLSRARAHTSPVLDVLSRTEQAIVRLGPILELLEAHPVARGCLPVIAESRVPPSRALASLRRLHGWFMMRENGLVYPFINLYFLSDVHFIAAFENWQRQHGSKLRGWFDCIGEIEALSSLAGYFHDEPSSCFAEFESGHAVFEATALGHPLIDPSERVTNDVRALLRGESLLVTGSNMSGKSTFLRSMGLGAVLGLAGGPVCATRVRLSPLQVATSMRVSDSLAGGISHFYAELNKLKSVLDSTNHPLPVFFLLDEILHGTNSKERQIGARHVLTALLRAGALGAVSTHDQALCELPGELSEHVTLVHLRENVTEGKMTFDYKVYPGPVTEGNALRLMRRVGIDVPLEQP